MNRWAACQARRCGSRGEASGCSSVKFGPPFTAKLGLRDSGFYYAEGVWSGHASERMGSDHLLEVRSLCVFTPVAVILVCHITITITYSRCVREECHSQILHWHLHLSVQFVLILGNCLLQVLQFCTNSKSSIRITIVGLRGTGGMSRVCIVPVQAHPGCAGSPGRQQL